MNERRSVVWTWRGALALCLLSAATITGLTLTRSDAAPADIAIEARPIDQFVIGSDAVRFGSLEYRGGFSYRGSGRRLSGVSSVRIRDEGRSFLAVTDTGYWFAGSIRRNANGAPVGFEQARIAPILDANGNPSSRKGEADAEGLAIDADRAIVSFERDHRIEAFDEAAAPFDSRPSSIELPIPLRELRSNGGIETIAVSPRKGPLKGATVIVAEQSIDTDGNLLAGILGKGDQGLFTVRRQLPWAVTDGAFLPGGDLLLLERRYEGFGRIGMRIRRIDGGTIRPGAVVDGTILMEADIGNEIDNMEGLDVWTNSAGDTILTLVSDDNGSFFQRNLYLEFRLVEDAGDTLSN